MIPIITPINSNRPTFEQRLFDAAAKAYIDQHDQEVFKAGARWATGGAEFTPKLLTFVAGIIWIVMNCVAFLVGILFASTGPGNHWLPGKWNFIFPFYSAGHVVGAWLSK